MRKRHSFLYALLCGIFLLLTSCGKDEVSVDNINLSTTSLTLEKGTHQTLSYSISPLNATNQDVTWASSDSSVASVSQSGEVTAHNGGTAVITVRSADSRVTAFCIITVVVTVTKIYLPTTSLTLEKGTLQTLSYSISPLNATNQDVTWASSDSSVASVSQSGEVTAHNGGTAVITVRSADSGVIASCIITVVVTATKISMSDETLSMTEGTHHKLSIKFTPADATNTTLYWYSSDETVATVSPEGEVKAIAPGTAMIMATDLNVSPWVITGTSDYLQATCEVTVKSAINVSYTPYNEHERW